MVVIVATSALWRRGVPAAPVSDPDADADRPPNDGPGRSDDDLGRPNDAPNRDVQQRLNDVNPVLLEQHEIHILTV